MSAKLLIIYGAIHLLWTIIDKVGRSDALLLESGNVNDAVGFQVDTVGSGGGVVGMLRTTVDFFTDFVPNLVIFNYGFLEGDLQVIRWALIMVFGMSFIGVVAFATLGSLRRNV